jgi:universal stress protein A
LDLSARTSASSNDIFRRDGTVNEKKCREVPTGVQARDLPNQGSAMKPELSIQRVLFATDLSPICESAFRYAADVANHFKARLYLLHVLPLSAAQLSDAQLVSEARLAEHRAEREMRRLREQLLASHDDYMMAVVSGQPASRIVEKAREMAADLIILGVHDPDEQIECPALDVARQVCESSPCPVTCVPCGKRDPGRLVGH